VPLLLINPNLIYDVMVCMFSR